MPGLFLASTLVDHTRVAETTEVVLATIRSLAEAPATDEDLVKRKATVTGGFHRAIETIDGIAGTVAEHVLYDVPLTAINEYTRRVQAVDAASVAAFADRSLVPDDFVVLVGDAAKFHDEIARAHPLVRTIPFESLDLGSPTLSH
jgi:zinc protease